MLVNRVRQKIEDARKSVDEGEERACRTRRLDIILELEQKFLEKPSSERNKQAIESTGTNKYYFAKRLVYEVNSEQRRVLLGSCESGFFHKKDTNRASSWATVAPFSCHAK